MGHLISVVTTNAIYYYENIDKKDEGKHSGMVDL